MTTNCQSRALGLLRCWGLVFFGLIFASCTTVNTQPAPSVDKSATWALLPILNYTETPQAGLRAEAILESLLRTGGVRNLRRYPASQNTDTLFDHRYSENL